MTCLPADSCSKVRSPGSRREVVPDSTTGTVLSSVRRRAHACRPPGARLGRGGIPPSAGSSRRCPRGRDRLASEPHDLTDRIPSFASPPNASSWGLHIRVAGFEPATSGPSVQCSSIELRHRDAVLRHRAGTRSRNSARATRTTTVCSVHPPVHKPKEPRRPASGALATCTNALRSGRGRRDSVTGLPGQRGESIRLFHAEAGRDHGEPPVPRL